MGYNTAIDQSDDRAVVKEALRSEVEDLRIAFRERAFESGASVVCLFMRKVLTEWDEAAVIYHDPSWGELTAGFARTQGGWVPLSTNVGLAESKSDTSSAMMVFAKRGLTSGLRTPIH